MGSWGSTGSRHWGGRRGVWPYQPALPVDMAPWACLSTGLTGRPGVGDLGARGNYTEVSHPIVLGVNSWKRFPIQKDGFTGPIGGPTQKIWIFMVFGGFRFFCWGSRRQDQFQWRPRPPGINFALISSQSCTLASILEHFWTFRWWVGPKFRTLFEKIDPLQPLRPKCWAENDPRLILYSFDSTKIWRFY